MTNKQRDVWLVVAATQRKSHNFNGRATLCRLAVLLMFVQTTDLELL